LETLRADYVYVFVFLKSEEFFVVPGGVILADVDHFFGASYRGTKPSKVPAINYGPLKKYRDNWEVFDQTVPTG